MACSVNKTQQRHALAIPLLAQGHTTPLMRFCRRLASEQAFAITFVDIQLDEEERGTQADQGTQKHESLQAAPEETKLNIKRVSIRAGRQEGQISGAQGLEAYFKSLESLYPSFEELLSRLILENPPITCLISDFFMTSSTQKVADKFGIPRVAFYTSSQSTLVHRNLILEGTISLDQVLQVLTSKDAPKEDIFVEGMCGLPALRNGDLAHYGNDTVFLYKFILQALKETKERAHALVVNTIKELEEPGLNVNIGNVPVYAVGPLVEPLDKDTSTSLLKEDSNCMLWLGKQPCRSVLYISFGSTATLSNAQFEEFAAGLLASQQRYLWVARSNLVSDAPNVALHAHLLSQSHGRGYVTRWAPQVSVLSHPAVGGFLTHCGWNSTIEAISLGVPLLCFPYFADQFLNAKFIIEEWKVGIGFQMCKESGLVKKDDVEEVICNLMVGEEGKILHKNAKKFGETLQQNLKIGSATSMNIKALVDSL